MAIERNQVVKGYGNLLWLVVCFMHPVGARRGEFNLDPILLARSTDVVT
jgi:hypothetical protein